MYPVSSRTALLNLLQVNCASTISQLSHPIKIHSLRDLSITLNSSASLYLPITYLTVTETMSQSTLRHLARCIPLSRQRHLLSSTTLRSLSTFQPLRSTKEQPCRPAEVDRACGVPQDSVEAGPRSPAGVLGPELWIIGPVALLTVIGLYYFMPSSPSKSGQAMQKRILDSRQAVEWREGDREQEETDAEKIEEAELMRKAAREKKMKATKAG
ncbi:hypothetical protein N7G274_008254 [Stereocaulon virgatum]|uniref:Uncharacterized protein n=1 Tax=Stereocaulon virgatum TaxID=373712 RepID=A0ABR4A2C2_9LECA